MRIVVRGAGVAGLAVATCLAEAGREVVVVDPAGVPTRSGASYLAGGMLAPWCEAEAAGAVLIERAAGAIDWWAAHVPGVVRAGTLVVAAGRDVPDLERFAARTTGFERVDAARIAELEPALAGRFGAGLFFPDEAHLDPRLALASLADALRRRGVACLDAEPAPRPGDRRLDCRGTAAGEALPGLRGIRGEMLMLASREIVLSRPVRLLHPRIPLYVVPRGDGRFMVGATMLEGGRAGRMTLRSAVELMNAAYALHPAFAEAEVLEFGAGLRPGFDDNLPAVLRDADGVWHANGAFRHGFLLGPWLGAQAVSALV